MWRGRQESVLCEYDLVTKKARVDRVAEAGMIGAIAHWCEFLQGKSRAQDALEELAQGLESEAVLLSRVSREQSGKSRILVFDSRAGLSRLTALDRSFARMVLGTYFERPKAGSIWFKSMLEHDIDPALNEFHRRRNLVDLVVIPLSIDEKTMDFVEIHFSMLLQFEHRALLNMVAGTLARTWKNRATGLMTQHFAKTVSRISAPVISAPILSMENPARLSRAEYRVCLLLSRGQTFETVQTELNVSASTLRTHLKNIYAKTECANQAELLYRLLTFATPDNPQVRQLASA